MNNLLVANPLAKKPNIKNTTNATQPKIREAFAYFVSRNEKK